MGVHSHAGHAKVKVTIECSADQRAYIKMLAAKAHSNISELVLSRFIVDFPRKHNNETLQAHKEALNGGGVDCDSLEAFWEQMGVNSCDLN